MEKEKLCLRCMRRIGDSNYCPHCRNENSQPQKAPFLPLKTIIGERYLVGKLVETNSEGSTYYAFDYKRKTPVTLRELYPAGMLSRGEDNYCLVNVGKVSEFVDIKDSFKKLWQSIAGIQGYNALVPVYDVIEDLGTVYVIYEYLGEGKTLREYLLENEQGYISWDEARVLMMPVLSALSELHANGIIHGGISPNTLIVDKNGKVRISGYAVQSLRRQKTGMVPEIFDGYAAVEQYGLNGDLTPATDIYAFAAVLYRALIGSVPMSAASRLTNDKLMIPGKFAEQLPAYVINALVNALQILPEDRTGNAELFRDELSASPTAAVNAAEAYSSMYAQPEPAEIPPVQEPVVYENVSSTVQPQDNNKLKKSTIAAFVISVILCLAILITVFFGMGIFSKDEEPSTEPTTEATTKEPEETEEVINMATPDFKGKKIDEIQADEAYNKVFKIFTKYVDDDKADIGVVVGQDITPGTQVSSINRREIVLKVSSGISVPELEGENMKDAVDHLKHLGFKTVEAVMGDVAKDADSSLKVYSVVYETEDKDWSAIPGDRHLSASDKLIVYYYGEFVEETEPQSEQTGDESIGEENENPDVNNGEVAPQQ